MVFVIFGLFGAGKTYIGNILQNEFGFRFIDGDDFLPEDMQQALNQQYPITNDMRNRFFSRLINEIKSLVKTETNIAIAQTFIKGQYRKQLLQEIPEAKFIFVDTAPQIREKRLTKRASMQLSKTYREDMDKNFDPPQASVAVITNNTEGPKGLKKQLEKVLWSS